MTTCDYGLLKNKEQTSLAIMEIERIHQGRRNRALSVWRRTSLQILFKENECWEQSTRHKFMAGGQ